MFRDTNEELRRLEQELLREETVQQEADEAPSAEAEEDYVNYQVLCPVYNTDRTDVDMEEYSHTVREPEKSLTGWIVLAFLLMTGIVCVLGYWLLRYLGVLG
ncbi:MAG: hypothetical protein J6A74_04370 [Oscillospiraceae bacterium]|nr:hypothetical protein [Oscillospiraceae bacterium]